MTLLSPSRSIDRTHAMKYQILDSQMIQCGRVLPGMVCAVRREGRLEPGVPVPLDKIPESGRPGKWSSASPFCAGDNRGESRFSSEWVLEPANECADFRFARGRSGRVSDVFHFADPFCVSAT